MKLSKMETVQAEIFLNVGSKENPRFERVVKFIAPEFKEKLKQEKKAYEVSFYSRTS